MSDFELDKLDWYTVDTVEPNDFINENLTSDEYGIYYSVKFVGNAESYLWQTKTEPVVGEDYWGMLQKAKSGKSIKFKWDKKNTPEDASKNTSQIKPKPAYQPKNNDVITLSMVWKTVAGIRGLPEDDEDFAKFFEIVDSHFKELILMGEKVKAEE